MTFSEGEIQFTLLEAASGLSAELGDHNSSVGRMVVAEQVAFPSP